MAEAKIPSKGGHKGLLTCIIIAVAGGIGLVCLAGLGIWYFSRTTEPSNRLFLTRISSPTTGLTALRGQTIDVQASSQNNRGVSRLDVYSDGGMIASQNSTLTGGSNPLVLIKSWTPLSPGRHVLVARARATDGSKSESSVVFVDVSEQQFLSKVNVGSIRTESGKPPTLNEIAASTGITLGALLDANPDLEGTDPDDPLDPDSDINLPPPSGSEGEEVPPPVGPAAAEDLTVTMECTQATLHWNDVSTDEDSYVIYRIDPGSATMNQIGAPLPANTENHVDPLPGLGQYYYQIGVRRGGEESYSMVVSATTPGTCVAPPAGSLDLMLTVAAVETDNAFANVFCYVTLTSAGSPWDRIPDGDFTGLPASGPNQYRLDSLPNRGRYLLNFHDPASPVEFELVCYGRNPPFADYIGEVQVSHPPADWDGTVRTVSSLDGTNGNYTLYYCLGPAATPCTPPGMPPAPPSPWVTDPYLPPPTMLHLAQSTETCLDLPTEGQRMWCQIFGALFGGYPTLLWEWNGAPHYQESDLTGYHVVLQALNRTTHNVTVIGEWDVLRRLDGTLGRALEDHADHSVCGVTYSYFASAAAGDIHSMESVPLEVETPDCFTPALVTVNISRLQIPAPANDCGDLNLFTGMEQILEIDGLEEVHSGLFNEFRDLSPNTTVTAGIDSTPSAIWGVDTQVVMPIISDSQTLDVRLRVADRDGWFLCPPDPVFCDVHTELPARSSAEWIALNQSVDLSSSNGEAGCNVRFSLVGSAP